MTTKLNSLEQLACVKATKVKYIASDTEVLVYENHEKTGCRINKEDIKKIRLHYQRQYSALKKGLSYKNIVPFYTKAIMNRDESFTTHSDYSDITSDNKIVCAVIKKYPFMFKDRFAIDNTINYLFKRIKIWNNTIIPTKLPAYII